MSFNQTKKNVNQPSKTLRRFKALCAAMKIGTIAFVLIHTVLIFYVLKLIWFPHLDNVTCPETVQSRDFSTAHSPPLPEDGEWVRIVEFGKAYSLFDDTEILRYYYYDYDFKYDDSGRLKNMLSRESGDYSLFCGYHTGIPAKAGFSRPLQSIAVISIYLLIMVVSFFSYRLFNALSSGEFPNRKQTRALKNLWIAYTILVFYPPLQLYLINLFASGFVMHLVQIPYRGIIVSILLYFIFRLCAITSYLKEQDALTI